MKQILIRGGLLVIAVFALIALLRDPAPVAGTDACCTKECPKKAAPAELIQDHFTRQFISISPNLY